MQYIPIVWDFKKEKEFQARLHAIFKKMWYVVYRIPDLWPAYRFFDAIILANNWQSWCLEYKIVEGCVINENKLEDIQHSTFKELLSLWHNPLVIVWSKKLKDYAIIPYSDFLTKINDKGQLDLKKYIKV